MVLGLALGGAKALAEEAQAPVSAPQTPAAATRPVVLDRLLKLPDGQRYGVERRGGLSRGEWLTRFTELGDALAAEQRGLAQAQVQLDETAQSTSNWQMNPIPGMEASPDAPLDYQLRLKIRRHKSEIERLENRLSELEIEANLAGVPEEWRS
ncbi:MAG: hypothetical protein ABFS41_03465 [Myxococcota bacterium]